MVLIKKNKNGLDLRVMASPRVVEVFHLGNSLFYKLDNGERYKYQHMTLAVRRKLKESLVKGIPGSVLESSLTQEKLSGARCINSETIEIREYDRETYTMTVCFCGETLRHFLRPDLYLMFLEAAEHPESDLLTAYKEIVPPLHHGTTVKT